MPPDPDTQPTNPHPDSYLQARLAEMSQGVPVFEVAREQREQPHPDSYLQTWLAEVSSGSPHPRSFPASCLITQAAHLKPDAEDEQQKPEQLHAAPQDTPGLDLQKLRWDPKLRLIFHHTDGNSAMKIGSEGGQELIAEPKAVIRGPDDPNLVKLLGCLQSRSEIKCSLSVKSLHCDFYYLPDSDDVLLENLGASPITLVPRSPGASPKKVQKSGNTIMQPAQWRLSCGDDAVDLQLLPRRHVLQIEADQGASAEKRPADDDASSMPPKKAKAPAGAVKVTSPRNAVAQPQPVVRRKLGGPVWDGVQLKKNGILKVTDAVMGCPEYSLRRSCDWFYHNSHTEVFKAVLDDGQSKPTAVIVKRIAFRTASGSKEEQASASAQASVTFMQELVAHRRLQHDRIVRLLGWDARILCLYIELKPSYDLSSPFWRENNGPNAGYFRGDVGDVYCILAHISSALAFLAKHGIAHNDIKPANILYSKADLPATGPYSMAAAGAVLIDFGLAEPASRVSSGGTPWYVGPELINGFRDLQSDVWALGIVALYGMRRIMLPEVWDRYPEWFIRDVRQKKPKALKAMQEWVSEIMARRERLRAPGLDARETGLKRVVYEMLSLWEDRITAAELEELTSKWDLSPFLETGGKPTE